MSLVPQVGRGPTPCPVCGGLDCRSFPDIGHLSTYPFLPGGRDPMEGIEWVLAPHRIIENGRVLYGTGDRVPLDVAKRHGIVPEDFQLPTELEPQARGRRLSEDRARHPSANR